MVEKKAFKPTRYPKISIAIDTDRSRKSSVHPWLMYPQLEHGFQIRPDAYYCP